MLMTNDRTSELIDELDEELNAAVKKALAAGLGRAHVLSVLASTMVAGVGQDMEAAERLFAKLTTQARDLQRGSTLQ